MALSGDAKSNELQEIVIACDPLPSPLVDLAGLHAGDRQRVGQVLFDFPDGVAEYE